MHRDFNSPHRSGESPHSACASCIEDVKANTVPVIAHIEAAKSYIEDVAAHIVPGTAHIEAAIAYIEVVTAHIVPARHT